MADTRPITAADKLPEPEDQYGLKFHDVHNRIIKALELLESVQSELGRTIDVRVTERTVSVNGLDGEMRGFPRFLDHPEYFHSRVKAAWHLHPKGGSNGDS